MKKWMTILLILALTVIRTGFAQALDVDFSGMSNDELLALMVRVQEEIAARHIEGTASLKSGAYLVGRDLPAGSYVFTCLAAGDDWGNVTVYSEKGEGERLLWEFVDAPEEGEEPESFFITLSADDLLKSDVPFSLTIYAGAMFQ